MMAIVKHLGPLEIAGMLRASRSLARYLLVHVMSKDGLYDARHGHFERVHHWSSDVSQWDHLYNWSWLEWNAHHALARTLRVVLSFDRDDRMLYRDCTPKACRVKSTQCQCCGGLSGVRETRATLGGARLCSGCRSSRSTRCAHAIELRLYRPLPPPMAALATHRGTRAGGNCVGTVLLKDVVLHCSAADGSSYHECMAALRAEWQRCLLIYTTGNRTDADRVFVRRCLECGAGSPAIATVLECCVPQHAFGFTELGQ